MLKKKKKNDRTCANHEIWMKRRISNERKKRSWVWKYFEDDKEKIENDKSIKWVKCTILNCNNSSMKMKKFNTSNMAHHLKQEHKILNEANDSSCEETEDAILIEFSKKDQDFIDVKLYVKHIYHFYFIFCLILLELTSLLPRIHRSP